MIANQRGSSFDVGVSGKINSTLVTVTSLVETHLCVKQFACYTFVTIGTGRLF